jgi:speckle-type POZ protein
MISLRAAKHIARYNHTSSLLNTRSSNLLDRARENGEFTDFEFTCKGHIILVHRVIICSHSPVFHAACTGKLKEASTQSYSLDSHSLPMVRRMVEFFYTSDYTEESEEEDTGTDTIPVLSIHAAMFTLADKYDIEELKVLSANKYSEYLTKNSNVTNFLLSISEVYNSTPPSERGLRDRALAFAREKLPRFLSLSDAKDEFDEVAADAPEFIKELLYYFIDDRLLGRCDNCVSKWVPVFPLDCRCRRCSKGGAISEIPRGNR